MSRVHIAGMLVHALPHAMDSVLDAARARGAIVRLTGVPGKFAVVLETAHEREIADVIATLQALPGIVAVSMTAHYVEDADALAKEVSP
jgi:nitrate reductase NapAB chaperone NapD